VFPFYLGAKAQCKELLSLPCRLILKNFAVKGQILEVTSLTNFFGIPLKVSVIHVYLRDYSRQELLFILCFFYSQDLDFGHLKPDYFVTVVELFTLFLYRH
jgi:hypothetical protein